MDTDQTVTALTSSRARKALLKIPDIEQKILGRMDDLLQAMLDRALGHYVVIHKFNKETGEVETRIYLEPPDVRAATFLIENVIGKVPQRIEMSGPDGGPVRVIPWMTLEEAEKLGLRTQITAPDAPDALPPEHKQDSEPEDVQEGDYRIVGDERRGGEASDYIREAFASDIGNDMIGE